MRTDGEEIVVYWDTSAVLSSLFSNEHSDKALEWANRDGFHFLSSLTYAGLLMQVINRVCQCPPFFPSIIQTSPQFTSLTLSH